MKRDNERGGMDADDNSPVEIVLPKAPKSLLVLEGVSFSVWCLCGLFGPWWLAGMAALLDAVVAQRCRNSTRPLPPPQTDDDLLSAQYAAVYFYFLTKWQAKSHTQFMARLAAYLVVVLAGVGIRVL